MFADRLRDARKAKRYSQTEVSRMLGVTQQAVGKWETGRSTPDPQTVARLAEILDTTADALLGLQQAPTQEQLAHTLTVVRRAMQAGGQWIAAVETTPGACAALRPKIVQTADGGHWWYAFTSFDEQMKSPDAVKSTFWADINSLFDAALAAEEIQGIILNPWHCTLQLDKTLIRIIKP